MPDTESYVHRHVVVVSNPHYLPSTATYIVKQIMSGGDLSWIPSDGYLLTTQVQHKMVFLSLYYTF